MAEITPPVALAVFAAAGLAKADMWQTGWEAVRIAAPTYIVPFMFVYEPSLLLIGDWVTSLTSFLSASIGVMCFAAALQVHSAHGLPMPKYLQMGGVMTGTAGRSAT